MSLATMFTIKAKLIVCKATSNSNTAELPCKSMMVLTMTLSACGSLMRLLCHDKYAMHNSKAASK